MADHVNKIPVVIAFDQDYLPPAVVMLTSLLSNASKSTFYDIHIFATDIDEKSLNTIFSLEKKYRCKINFLEPSSGYEDIPIHEDRHQTVPNFYRFLMPRLLPNYDKVIWCDVDMIITGDLADIYFWSDLQENLFAAVEVYDRSSHIDSFKPENNISRYFNAGFVIWNLKLYREMDLITQTDHILRSQRFDFPTQHPMNLLGRDKTLFISSRYNFRIGFYRHLNKIIRTNDEVEINRILANEGITSLDSIMNDPVVFHWTGKRKPWIDSKVEFADYWWRYFNESGIDTPITYFTEKRLLGHSGALDKYPSKGHNLLERLKQRLKRILKPILKPILLKISPTFRKMSHLLDKYPSRSHNLLERLKQRLKRILKPILMKTSPTFRKVSHLTEICTEILERQSRILARSGKLERTTTEIPTRIHNYVLMKHPEAISGISRDSICIDCGAHKGYVAETFLKLGAKVYAFEPNIYLANYIRFRLSDFIDKDRLIIHNKALWIEDGSLNLYLDESYSKDNFDHSISESSSIIEGKTEAGATYRLSKDNYFKVDSIDFCEYVRALDSDIHIVKMDVEGAEFHILEKLIAAGLHNRIKYIFVEAHEHKLPSIQPIARKVRELIEKKNITNIYLDWK